MADAITVIEEAILAELQSVIPSTDYTVARFPERPAEYRLRHYRGAVLVNYPGSKYTDDANGMNVRTMQWVITILVKGVQTHHAAYPLLQKVIATLDGFEPPSCRKMRMQYDKFITENGAVWQYDMLFHVERAHISGHDCLDDTIL